MARKPARPRVPVPEVDPREIGRRHNVDLAEIDLWMRRAYDRIKKELDAVDAQLEELAEKRAQLASRAEQLELGLGIHDQDEDVEDDEDDEPFERVPVEQPRRRPLAPPPRPRRRRKKHGALWQDVSASIQGVGPMQASDIIQRLVASGYEDNENLRTRVYNSLGRWAREGKLSKRSRGMYEFNGD